MKPEISPCTDTGLKRDFKVSLIAWHKPLTVQTRLAKGLEEERVMAVGMVDFSESDWAIMPDK